MSSSEEALRVLLEWKTKKTSLHLELICPDEPRVVNESTQVSGANSGVLTVLVGGWFKDFHFVPGGLELYTNVPQRFKNRVRSGIKLTSVNGEEVILVEVVKT